MRLSLCLLLLTALSLLFAPASSTLPLTDFCPTVVVICPDEVGEDGKTLTFKAEVKGASPQAKLTYHWSISAGTISKGQNSSSITVDTAGVQLEPVTATVEVVGLMKGCPNKASCTTAVARVVGCHRPFDQYGNIGAEDEAARLDNFAIQLGSEPTVQAYIYAYDGRGGRPGSAESRARRAKNYVVEVRGADRERITVVAGGFREEMTFELMLIPPGLEPPQPSPTLSPEEAQALEKRANSKPCCFVPQT